MITPTFQNFVFCMVVFAGTSPTIAGSLAVTGMSPTPGVVRAVRVASGDAVRAGDPLVVLESMKVEHTLRAPADGVVRAVLVDVGEAVAGGALLVRLDPAGEG